VVLAGVAVLAPAAAQTGAPATVTTATEDQQQAAVVLENEFWKLSIWPGEGGKIKHAVYKVTGSDWIYPGGGLFADHVTQQTWPGELYRAAYEYAIIASGPDVATVRLWRKIEGNGDVAITGVIFEKEITLRRGDPRIHVVIRLKNPTDVARSPIPWTQNLLYMGGDKENDRFFRPSTTGVQESWNEYSATTVTTKGSDFVREPTAGWSAVADTVKGEGAVFEVKYDDLYWLYNCTSSLTLEWWDDPVPLAAGASWETPVTIVPFTGLKSVDYADAKLVAAVDTAYSNQKLSATLRLVSTSATPVAPVTATVTLYTHPEMKVVSEETVTIPSVGRTPSASELALGDLVKTQPGLIRVKLASGDYTANFEKYFDPLAAEKAQFGQVNSSYYVPRPRKNKVFALPAGAKVERHAAPLVLVYEGLHSRYWGLDETFRRIKAADVKTAHHTIFVYGDQLDYMAATPEELLKYDLIVISNVPGEAFTDVGQAFLKLYVEHGGSLLVLGGLNAYGAGSYAAGDLGSILPVKVDGPYDRVKLSSGVPVLPAGALGAQLFPDWAAPELAPRAYWLHKIVAVQPGAEVIMKAGSYPAIVTGHYGQGRVAAVLLTPYGVPAAGETGFWQWHWWPRELAHLIDWLRQPGEAK
jgi:uncharacterized membrane protein